MTMSTDASNSTFTKVSTYVYNGSVIDDHRGIRPGEHPIVPILLGEASLAVSFADKMLQHGIYVIGFSFPVVPRGQARIRTQMNAALTRDELDRALAAFGKVGKELGVI